MVYSIRESELFDSELRATTGATKSSGLRPHESKTIILSLMEVILQSRLLLLKAGKRFSIYIELPLQVLAAREFRSRSDGKSNTNVVFGRKVSAGSKIRTHDPFRRQAHRLGKLPGLRPTRFPVYFL